MSEVDLSRRAALLSVAATGTVLLSGCAARAQTAKPGAGAATASSPSTTPQAGPGVGRHLIEPLPFNPTSLKGLSEKLIASHHDNNYAGAVKNLNRAEEELSRVTKDTPPFVVGGLKQNELVFRNSATLHELYFGNLGGDGKPNGAVEKALAEANGGLARWEELFRATGTSLGGGSGWVVTGFDLHRNAPVTFWSGNHSQVLASTIPLLVMDMYEHAYQMDYGAAAAKYIDAFFANVQWDEVNRRFEHAKKAAVALRG